MSQRVKRAKLALQRKKEHADKAWVSKCACELEQHIRAGHFKDGVPWGYLEVLYHSRSNVYRAPRKVARG